jgi:hypothetical protein
LKYSKSDIEKLFHDIYDGNVSPKDLPEDLYLAIGAYLFEGVADGVTSNIEFGMPDLELVAKLRENVYMFSAAKTFHQTLEMSDALVDDKGVLRPFDLFKEAANEIYVKYNGGTINNVVKPGWIEAEYNTAVAQASNAKKWDAIEKQKSLFPYLRYNANGEACPICAPLNGIVLRVGHPFWDRYAPLNHFNCNCILEQLEFEEGADSMTDDDTVDRATSRAKVPDEFKFNPGREKEVFSTSGETKHPYFTVPRKYENFAKNNFNLRMPKE